MEVYEKFEKRKILHQSSVTYLGTLWSAATEGISILCGHLQHLGVEVCKGVACVSDTLFKSYQCGYCIGLVSFESKTSLEWNRSISVIGLT